MERGCGWVRVGTHKPWEGKGEVVGDAEEGEEVGMEEGVVGAWVGEEAAAKEEEGEEGREGEEGGGVASGEGEVVAGGEGGEGKEGAGATCSS